MKDCEEKFQDSNFNSLQCRYDTKITQHFIILLRQELCRPKKMLMENIPETTY